MRKQTWQNLIVGLLTAAVLAYGMYFVYQTSEEGSMLLNKIILKTKMKSTQGLKRYASVRLHGIPSGKIETVTFSTQPGVDEVSLTFSLDPKYAELIAIPNPDPGAPANQPEPDGTVIYSYIKIDSEGLLGDNLIEIYAGDPTRAKAEAPKRIHEAAVRTVREQWEKQEKIWDEAQAAADIQAVEKRLAADVPGLEGGHIVDGSFMRPKTGGAGLAGITDSFDPLVKSVSTLLDEARTGQGLLGALIYDKEIPDRLKGILAKVEGTLAGNDIKKALADVSATTDSVRLAVADVQAIMDDLEKKKVTDNIKGTLANVEEITRAIKDGEGTIGALIKDKSLYEDIQAIMGSAGRSEVVKQAVRYAKERGEKQQAKEKAKEEQK